MDRRSGRGCSRLPIDDSRPGGASIPRVYIIGPAQRMGLGRLLLNAAIEQAGAMGLFRLWLDVMASATAARRAYEMGLPRNR